MAPVGDAVLTEHRNDFGIHERTPDAARGETCAAVRRVGFGGNCASGHGCGRCPPARRSGTGYYLTSFQWLFSTLIITIAAGVVAGVVGGAHAVDAVGADQLALLDAVAHGSAELRRTRLGLGLLGGGDAVLHQQPGRPQLAPAKVERESGPYLPSRVCTKATAFFLVGWGVGAAARPPAPGRPGSARLRRPCRRRAGTPCWSRRGTDRCGP